MDSIHISLLDYFIIFSYVTMDVSSTFIIPIHYHKILLKKP